MASATTKASKPCASRSIAVCSTQTCASMPPITTCGPPLAAKLMQPFAQGLVAQAGEFDLVDDEAGIGGGFADRIDGRTQALRILLRQRDRHVRAVRAARTSRTQRSTTRSLPEIASSSLSWTSTMRSWDLSRVSSMASANLTGIRRCASKASSGLPPSAESPISARRRRRAPLLSAARSGRSRRHGRPPYWCATE